MSRVIDETKPLSDADRGYLDQRGQYHVIERIDYLTGAVAGEVQAEPDSGDMSEAETRAGKAYEQWTVAELQAEVDKRNQEIQDDSEKLTKPTKKSDLIDVLREDDEALANDAE